MSWSTSLTYYLPPELEVSQFKCQSSSRAAGRDRRFDGHCRAPAVARRLPYHLRRRRRHSSSHSQYCPASILHRAPDVPPTLNRAPSGGRRSRRSVICPPGCLGAMRRPTSLRWERVVPRLCVRAVPVSREQWRHSVPTAHDSSSSLLCRTRRYRSHRVLSQEWKKNHRL